MLLIAAIADQKQSKKPTCKSLANTAVFLQTNYRSGSTFLGQIFNQHPDVFYTFEPLYMFMGNPNNHTELRLDTVRQSLQCNFKPTADTYSKLSWQPDKSSVLLQCLLNDLCFRFVGVSVLRFKKSK